MGKTDRTRDLHWALSLLESVFGPLGRESQEATRRRCAKCNTRFKMKEPQQPIVMGGNLTEEMVEEHNRKHCYDSTRFCSWQCAVNDGPQSGELTRQRLRQMARIRAKREIAAIMGSGPGCSNPRWARRRAMLSMAGRLHRERAREALA